MPKQAVWVLILVTTSLIICERARCTAWWLLLLEPVQSCNSTWSTGTSTGHAPFIHDASQIKYSRNSIFCRWICPVAADTYSNRTKQPNRHGLLLATSAADQGLPKQHIRPLRKLLRNGEEDYAHAVGASRFMYRFIPGDGTAPGQDDVARALAAVYIRFLASWQQNLGRSCC